MEVLTNESVSPEQIKKVVKKEGGCFVWGDAARLSPADDILIKIKKALDISKGQLIASVLSKKAAAGATHVIIDMPVGETAKVRNQKTAQLLKSHIETVVKTLC